MTNRPAAPPSAVLDRTAAPPTPSTVPPGPTPPTVPPGPTPTPTTARSLAPDLARGLMLLLIAVANVWGYLEGRALGPGSRPVDGTTADRVVDGLVSDRLRQVALGALVVNAVANAPYALVVARVWAPADGVHLAAHVLHDVSGMVMGVGYVCLFAWVAAGLARRGRRGPFEVWLRRRAYGTAGQASAA